jgi:hypothetical protein
MQSEEIEKYLKNLKFKKNIFGGLDEADVWKKIKKLDELYQKELEIYKRISGD